MNSSFAKIHFKSLASMKLHFSFGRKVGKYAEQAAKGKLSDVKKQVDAKQKMDIGLVKAPEDRKDRQAEDIDELFMSKCHLDVQKFPEKAMKRAQQVFSKYPHQELRKMGADFMKMYQQLHATEKPSNISQSVPFENTEQLAESADNPNNILYLRGEKETAEEMDEKIEKKRKEKNSKKDKNNKEEDKNNDADENENEGQTEPKEKEPDFKSSTNNNIKMSMLDYTQNTATAYLLRKAPHTYGIACRIFTEIRYRMPTFNPKQFLDFGAGVGSGSIAFFDIFPECKNIVACEPSRNMRKLGKHMTQDIPNMVYVENLAQTISLPYSFEFDIVYVGHVLQEVPSVEARKLIIESLWGKVKQGGLMIFVENGTPKGFRFVHDFRKYILENKKEDKPYIISPCPHQGPCPLAEKANTWCHFDQKISKYPKSVFSKLPTERQFDHEKFCYMVIQKGRKAEEYDEDNAVSMAQKSFFWDRILFPIMKKSNHVMYDMCTRDGEFERRVTAKSHGPIEYRTIKKLEWGDLWPYVKRIPNKFRKEGPGGPRLW